MKIYSSKEFNYIRYADPVLNRQAFRRMTLYKLLNSEPENVYQELKKHHHSIKRSTSFMGKWLDTDHFYAIELALKKRNIPLINLALAKYGTNPKVLSSLSKSNNKAIRIGCLQNKFLYIFGKNGIFDDLVLNGSYEELAILFANEAISYVIDDLYNKSGVFKNISEERWQKILFLSSRNPVLTFSYDPREYDPSLTYEQNKIIEAAWNLLITVPANDIWAKVLYNLLEEINLPINYKEYNLTNLFYKWTDTTDQKLENVFTKVRVCIARLIPEYDTEFKSLRISSDIALRCSYYRRFHYVSVKDIEEMYEKDGRLFIDEAIENNNLYYNTEARKILSSLAFKAYSELPIMFKFRYEKLRRDYPNKFNNEPNDISLPEEFNHIEENLENINENVSFIGKIIQENYGGTQYIFLKVLIGVFIAELLIRLILKY